jgi:NAD(P)H dehydrogenase (quinone)
MNVAILSERYSRDFKCSRNGLQWCPYGHSAGENMEQTGVTEQRLEAAKYHGANVARVAAALASKELFAK